MRPLPLLLAALLAPLPPAAVGAALAGAPRDIPGPAGIIPRPARAEAAPAAQALVVLLPEAGAAATTARLVEALRRAGLATLELRATSGAPGEETEAVRGALATAEADGFAPGRIGILAVGIGALAALKAAGERPVALLEPACEAREVPRPMPVLLLAGAALEAACPPPPPWRALEWRGLPGPLAEPAVGVAAAEALGSWLGERLAAGAEAPR